jgi:hypothetical protein
MRENPMFDVQMLHPPPSVGDLQYLKLVLSCQRDDDLPLSGGGFLRLFVFGKYC